ncbi:arsenical pump-driving ATPase [Bacillus alkalicellulosilyticus]|uniref:arsenical pump-driving ATPase n=1 Tax=Alkalihalobacterium alkalicellulosilyticum TaxID=1912214 RepID=UPI0009987E40|nr:arsenical pump-driving ATPase [Bacillus alkalicellulosilyticus]
MYKQFQPTAHNLTPYLFFTGKGGVGKTSTACATAVHLALEGKRVLLVSTDPASNLQDVFEVPIHREPVRIPGVTGLYAVNINPEEVAKAYRERVIGPYRDKLPAPVVSQMEEQLSGACTVEIAAFDEFTSILTNDLKNQMYDHIIFDTAPTGHTLRLLQLPSAWTHFLDQTPHGASCLGPLAGLEAKKNMYNDAVEVLSDKAKTTVILVTRPDISSIEEANRASKELKEVGLENQWLLINGKLQEYKKDDVIASAFYEKQEEAIKHIPKQLLDLTTYEIPYVPYQLTGIASLKSLFTNGNIENPTEKPEIMDMPTLENVVVKMSERKTGVVMTMGKGGVGKTTVAAAIAVGLAEKGLKVKLTTTDPAAHLSYVFQNTIEDRITLSEINPTAEVEKYRKQVLLQAKAKGVDEEGLAYLEEDLQSPCTEEIAVFQAFAKVVEEAEDCFVVIDTAPTGHTLLLLDATQSYQKEVERTGADVHPSVQKLLPRLRNEKETDVVIVTLPEATPVYEASRLQDDLKRAGITPSWWVINQSLAATQTTDPILHGRALSEGRWIKEVTKNNNQVAVIPWQVHGTIGYELLKSLVN